MRALIRDTEIYFDVDGVGLAVEEGYVVERPTAFILHGGPGFDHLGLKARDEKLTDSMQLVYIDYRGGGRSARADPEKYTLDENVEDLEALRRYLGLGRIVCHGTSYGGMVAMAYAARYPDSASHLILVATAAHPGFVERAKQLVRERGTARQIEQCEALFAGKLDTVEKLRHFVRVMGPLYAHQYEAEPFDRGLDMGICEPVPLNRAHGPDGYMRRTDLRPELARITAPTLIIGGRHDWICAPEFSEEIHRLIQGSELKIFEESAHSVGSDEPENYLTTIAGFVRRNATADSKK